MANTFPAIAGFREVARQPALVLGEIVWRWSFAAGAWSLVIVAFVEYLKSLPVSARDELLLRTGRPLLIGKALHNIFHDSGARLGTGIIIVGLAIAVLWVFAATVGRLASLKALRAEREIRAGFRSLLGLNFFRAGLFLAAMLASVGVLIITGITAPDNPAAAGATADLAFGFVALVWFVWCILNWLLSLAAVLALSDDEDTFGSVAAAANLLRTRFVDVVATSAPFVALHYFVFIFASYFGFLLLALMARFAGVFWPVMFLTALPYFAIVDFLYITRMAAYVALLNSDSAPPASKPASVVPSLPLAPEPAAGD